MEEPSSSSAQTSSLELQGENVNLQEQCSKVGRRNALTPESHHIEPIRQAEIQEKISNLSMSASTSSGSGGGSSGSGDHHSGS